MTNTMVIYSHGIVPAKTLNWLRLAESFCKSLNKPKLYLRNPDLVTMSTRSEDLILPPTHSGIMEPSDDPIVGLIMSHHDDMHETDLDDGIVMEDEYGMIDYFEDEEIVFEVTHRPILDEEDTQYAEVLASRYKPVAQKVKPVPGVFPEDARVIRQFPEDPLQSLVPLPFHTTHQSLYPLLSHEGAYGIGRRRRGGNRRRRQARKGSLPRNEIDSIYS